MRVKHQVTGWYIMEANGDFDRDGFILAAAGTDSREGRGSRKFGILSVCGL